jgi:hypothetical protein
MVVMFGAPSCPQKVRPLVWLPHQQQTTATAHQLTAVLSNLADSKQQKLTIDSHKILIKYLS